MAEPCTALANVDVDMQGVPYAVCQEEDAGVVGWIFRPADDSRGQAAPLEVVRQVRSN